MDEADRHFCETEETARARVAQARDLRNRAKTGGLRFEAYLPSDLALWVLDMVEDGTFVDPSEAVFVFMQQARELDPHGDLKKELLSRSIEAAQEGPTYTMEEVRAHLETAMERRTPAVCWKKIDNPAD